VRLCRWSCGTAQHRLQRPVVSCHAAKHGPLPHFLFYDLPPASNAHDVNNNISAQTSQANAWKGPYLGSGPRDTATWQPFQRPDVITPPFPAWVSGHSTFSAAAARVRTSMHICPHLMGMPKQLFVSVCLGDLPPLGFMRCTANKWCCMPQAHKRLLCAEHLSCQQWTASFHSRS
jgi:hypothetical protein